jgi:lambda family phage minor tail protein L
MAQLSTVGLATLFQLDTTMLGGPIFYFTSAEDFAHAIIWGGQEYTALPMQAGGFDMTTKGAIPTPSVTISNLYGAANLLLADYHGLLGAKLIRIITLTRFFDDGATPDANAFISRDVYVVAQKTVHTAISITFKLASQMDQEGVQLPRRLILRDICSHVYRVWDDATGGFDYSLATCPYTGGGFFDINNTPSSPQSDSCQRTIAGCQARFGSAPLPAWFFPSVGRVK